MSFSISICHLSKRRHLCVAADMHLMSSVDSILATGTSTITSTRGRCRVRVSSIKGPAGIGRCHLCTALLCIVHCTSTADTLVTLEPILPNVTGAQFARALTLSAISPSPQEAFHPLVGLSVSLVTATFAVVLNAANRCVCHCCPPSIDTFSMCPLFELPETK